MNNVRELLSKAEKLLQPIDTARLDAEILLAATLNTERSRLYAQPEEKVDDNLNADYQSLLLKRKHGFPVAYLLGEKEFWSLKLNVTQDTLIPRPETERLVELALEFIPQNTEMRILDLGTGSGAIAIAIAKERPKCELLAVDISKDALTVAQGNVTGLKTQNVEIRESNWFDSLTNESFDLIVSNPPYVESEDTSLSETDIRYEPRLALDAGPSGLQAFNSIIPSAQQHMNEGAYLLVEHGYAQGACIRRLFELHHYTDINTQKDYAGLERISMGRFI